MSLKKIITTIIGIALFTPLIALAVYTASQGGTGISVPTPGQLLVGSSTGWTQMATSSLNIQSVWGNITGTLSSQTDLQNALNAKLSTTTAASTYYLQTNPTGYITSSALTPYLSTTTAAATYLSTTTAASTYAPINNPTLTGLAYAPTEPDYTDSSDLIATTKFAQSIDRGFMLMGYSPANAATLASSTTFYFGSIFNLTITTTATVRRIYVGRAGTIKAVYAMVQSLSQASSGQSASLYIRKNNTTDTLVDNTNLTLPANTVTAFGTTTLAIPVVAGDYIEMKLVTPAWTTLPYQPAISTQIYVQ